MTTPHAISTRFLRWGELVTHSGIQKGVAGVFIDGAVRESDDIIALKFPAFSKLVTPNAGNGKGLVRFRCR